MICWQAAFGNTFSRCVFLDRDGVINERVRHGYVTQWADFRLCADAAVCMRLLQDAGWPLIIVSNQACVGKGILTDIELVNIMDNLRWTLASRGIYLTAWYCCPHAPETQCSCRKPRTGMLEAAALAFGLDLTQCHLIGDSESDILAASAVGCEPHRIDPAFTGSLRAAVNNIIARQGERALRI